MNRYYILLNLLLCIAIMGCGSAPQRPEGFPPLYAVELTITQEGTPLAEASVTFHPMDSSQKWSSGGRTDEKGIVKIVTHGQFQGVAKGKYKITVDKLAYEPPDNKALSPSGFPRYPDKQFALVEAVYRHKELTTLEIDVQGKTQQTIDLGKPVRVLIPDSAGV